MTSYLPIFIKNKENKPVLIIGGGEIAAAKAEALASVGAQIEVIGKSLNNHVIKICSTHHYRYNEAE